ncbi:MAG: 2,3-bisphosphoglycerate-independent phosphoglycerate mutase, partial [Saprospiraceae bacterium]|nr:2,3-bisphosphoglycerate-independent phosphoglycerate mutase [Saprospiraceae bacterium]
RSQLLTHGKNVGLPEGQMGNSEVGHLNIGAGRIVYQDLALINEAIDTGSIIENPRLQDLISTVKKKDRKLHILGLLSDGGVHAHMDHLYALLDLFENENLNHVYIHGFLDGRDTDPKSGVKFIQDVESHITQSSAQLVSVIGRYYAMDRDQRWDRIKKAYDLLVKGEGEEVEDFEHYVRNKYDEGITDEFMRPAYRLTASGQKPVIQDGDCVLFFNYRTDRPRQLTEVLTQEAHPRYDMEPLSLRFYTMTEYDKHFKNVKVMFQKEVLKGTFGEYLSELGMKQLRAAETEKYPHVTYFFNGGKEEAFDNEERILIDSPKVATYDMKPEMSASELTEAVIGHVELKEPEAIIINYANADMVGHTGSFEAAVKACEAVDHCLRQLTRVALERKYRILIIADHGNADYMVNDDGTPNTAHTMNPVPCIAMGMDAIELEDGILADVAPTLLQMMGLEIPESMTGSGLIKPD